MQFEQLIHWRNFIFQNAKSNIMLISQSVFTFRYYRLLLIASNSVTIDAELKLYVTVNDILRSYTFKILQLLRKIK